MDVSNLPPSAKKHFDTTANRAVETENPQAVLEELETSYLCDGLDNMVRAGGVAAAAIVASPQGMRATLTDEGFDADTYALCKTLVTLHEKKQEKAREEARRRELESSKSEHGMVLASITGFVDSMLPIGTVDGDVDPLLGGDGLIGREESLQTVRSYELSSGDGGENGSGEGGAGGPQASPLAPKLPLVPPLAQWTTEKERRQAWKHRMQLILDVPQGSVVGKAYFVFVSLVVIMSSITSVVETMPIVNPTVRPQYYSLWNGLEWFATSIFTLDFLARLFVYTFDESLPTSPIQNLIQFCKSPVNIIDFITLLPQFIQPAFSGRIITGNLRTLRLLRLYKVVRRFQGFHRLSLALSRSFSSLVGPLAFLAACVFFLSAVLFAAERGHYDPSRDSFLVADPLCDNQPVSFLNDGPIPAGSPCPRQVVSKFVSQWQAFWWCVVTMCTVGYGDFTPTTWVGRLVATFTIIVGMVFFSMPIAVVGTNYTIAVQMTSKNEEADKEDALQREDQRDHELVGGATHPGRRLLKLLGELLLAQQDVTGPALSVSSSAPAAILNLCAPSLNDLYVIEGVLEAVVTSMIVGKPEAALPLWIAKWPAGVRESFRKREAVYRSAVISRPLILHVGSEGKTADAHQVQFYTSSNNNNDNGSSNATNSNSNGGGRNRADSAGAGAAAAAASVASRKGQQESAASAVVGSAITYPDEGHSIPRVVIYTPEIRSAIESWQLNEARRRRQIAQDDEDALRNVPTTVGTNDVIGVLPSLRARSNQSHNARSRGESLHDELSAINPPTVLPHHATMCCMRVWGEPTFLIFSKASAKEAVLRSTTSRSLVPPLDLSLLQESVQQSLRRLFADGMVQSLRSFQQAQQDAAAVSSAPASGSGSSSSASGSRGASSSSPSSSSSFSLLKHDFSIEQLVFRHAVMKQQQWLALELKPIRVKHGDILSFGAAQNELLGIRVALSGNQIDTRSSTSHRSDGVMQSGSCGAYLNYRFEDNSNGMF